jgi:hypothetical protein
MGISFSMGNIVLAKLPPYFILTDEKTSLANFLYNVWKPGHFSLSSCGISPST